MRQPTDQPISDGKKVTDASGIVQAPSFELPLSEYMSAHSKQAFISRNFNPPELREIMLAADINVLRNGMDKYLFKPMLERARQNYAVHIDEDYIDGVSVSIVQPVTGIAAPNHHRVLINLHGGFFMVGAGSGGQLESTAVAAIQGIKVVSVNYRQGPEYQFPAASEDVAIVYRKLLEDYPAGNIGIFGASAGGMLTAMALAWLQTEQLPIPGAIALLSAGATASMAGDSSFLGQVAMGEVPPAAESGQPIMPVPYLAAESPHNPLVAPVVAPDILKKFPPTLLLTGTRAFDLSAAIKTQRCLRSAGVEVDLQLWDGMWHCFFYDVELPESIEALTLLADFFDKKLGSQSKGTSGTRKSS